MATVTGYPGSFRKMSEKELTTEEWRAEKKRKKAAMAAMQALPYEVKVRRAEQRAYEFIEELDRRGMNAHVSVGGPGQHYTAGFPAAYRD